MSRRLAALGAVTLAAGLLVTPATAGAAQGSRAHSGAGPPTVTPADIEFTPGTSLDYGSASEAGLVPEYVNQLVPDVKKYLEPSPDHPLYSGAVVMAGRNGTIARHEAAGYARRYAAYRGGQAAELPRSRWVPARRDTIFDLASMSKVFTAVAVMQQVEAGRLQLDKPVADYIPAFAQHGKGDITVRQLLTHTSGLPAWLPLYTDWDTPRERIAAVYAVKPESRPGASYNYSDLGYITLGKLVEEVSGKGLDKVVAGTITEPLGIDDTMYTPPDSLRHRIAATEYQPWADRGMVWGSVHDENAWSLGGVAGHAGLFSTARDLATFAQMLLNGGVYDGKRVLESDTVRTMLRDWNAEFPGDEHGLGFGLAQRWYMDGLTTPVTFGHTGFTGTSLVVDPASHSFAILLTNRVHPTREWGSNNPARRAVARDLGRAIPVKPAEGRHAWFSGIGSDRTATLSIPLDVPDRGGRIAFDLWYDTEGGYDLGRLEVSRDGGSTWQPVSLTLRANGREWSPGKSFSGFGGRRWLQAGAQLPGGTTDVRWRYTSDGLYQGRGVYVDGVRAWERRGEMIFNGHRPSDAELFRADGWYRSAN